MFNRKKKQVSRLDSFMDALRIEEGVFYGMHEKYPIELPKEVECESGIMAVLTFISDAVDRECVIKRAYPSDLPSNREGLTVPVEIEKPDQPGRPYVWNFIFDITNCGGPKRKKDYDYPNQRLDSQQDKTIPQEDSLRQRIFGNNTMIDIPTGAIGRRSREK